MRRSLAIVAGLAMAALAVPGTAHAASIRTQFTEFGVTPLQSDIDHPRTYQGRLVYKDAGGTEHGLAGATVSLQEENRLTWVPLGTTTTDGDGRFSGSVNYAHVGSLVMRYEPPSGSNYYYATSNDVQVYPIQVASRISMSLAPKPQFIGDKVTVSGVVERVRPDGSWVVVPSQPVRVFYVPSDTQSPEPIATTHSTSDGTYQIPVAIPGSNGRILVDDYDGGTGPYRTAQASSAPLFLSYYRTRIVGFDAGPEPVKKGRTLTVRGTLQWYAKTKTWRPLKGVSVAVYFKKSGSTAMTKMATVTSDRYGRWQKKFKAARDGTWYATALRKDPYLPIATSGDYVDVR
ncbi:hypothetical protein NE236_20815 [Actinoallomurus purpureus]|uniref:hypothetical protein n=1 Tax=Actinoallomurus purpureus TaxID=478114 RepID=UPI0020931DB6|nr:hypothetical protein [Actinoallomurus purpureus]MCO6007425.1 hypothetical protein [Actinoallomurus purpureus]